MSTPDRVYTYRHVPNNHNVGGAITRYCSSYDWTQSREWPTDEFRANTYYYFISPLDLDSPVQCWRCNRNRKKDLVWHIPSSHVAGLVHMELLVNTLRIKRREPSARMRQWLGFHFLRGVGVVIRLSFSAMVRRPEGARMYYTFFKPPTSIPLVFYVFLLEKGLLFNSL